MATFDDFADFTRHAVQYTTVFAMTVTSTILEQLVALASVFQHTDLAAVQAPVDTVSSTPILATRTSPAPIPSKTLTIYQFPPSEAVPLIRAIFIVLFVVLPLTVTFINVLHKVDLPWTIAGFRTKSSSLKQADETEKFRRGVRYAALLVAAAALSVILGRIGYLVVIPQDFDTFLSETPDFLPLKCALRPTASPSGLWLLDVKLFKTPLFRAFSRLCILSVIDTFFCDICRESLAETFYYIVDTVSEHACNQYDSHVRARKKEYFLLGVLCKLVLVELPKDVSRVFRSCKEFYDNKVEESDPDLDSNSQSESIETDEVQDADPEGAEKAYGSKDKHEDNDSGDDSSRCNSRGGAPYTGDTPVDSELAPISADQDSVSSNDGYIRDGSIDGAPGFSPENDAPVSDDESSDGERIQGAEDAQFDSDNSEPSEIPPDSKKGLPGVMIGDQSDDVLESIRNTDLPVERRKIGAPTGESTQLPEVVSCFDLISMAVTAENEDKAGKPVLAESVEPEPGLSYADKGKWKEVVASTAEMEYSGLSGSAPALAPIREKKTLFRHEEEQLKRLLVEIANERLDLVLADIYARTAEADANEAIQRPSSAPPVSYVHAMGMFAADVDYVVRGEERKSPLTGLTISPMSLTVDGPWTVEL
ncbi:hypothetical protein K488DRAFT_88834 [Vararia minispora EC-137]|uniref:Uncharacterized protein n=1 Tax=Vararia minispora EC-137 TaxID=1314806 RepID=A0ACB8QCK4_9AGAM|nr:hypothetical protein K488DRAFT_88834 [Vararia minispora EC-137]